MRVIDRRRVRRVIGVTCAMIGMGACASFWRGGNAPRITYPLVVNNRTDFEVVVYAVLSAGSPGMRLGNARSFSTMTMTIPRNALQPTDLLVLRLHGIGSASGWTSPATAMDTGVVAQLDIRADAQGNLSRSSLYTEIATISRRP